MDRITDASKNRTLATTSLRLVTKRFNIAARFGVNNSVRSNLGARYPNSLEAQSVYGNTKEG